MRFEVDEASAFGAAEGRRYRRGQYQIRFARGPDPFAENDRDRVRPRRARGRGGPASAGGVGWRAGLLPPARGRDGRALLSRDEIETGDARPPTRARAGASASVRSTGRRSSVLLTDGCDRPPKPMTSPTPSARSPRPSTRTTGASMRTTCRRRGPGPTRSGWEVRGEVGVELRHRHVRRRRRSGFGRPRPHVASPRRGRRGAPAVHARCNARCGQARVRARRVPLAAFATSNVLTGPIVAKREHRSGGRTAREPRRPAQCRARSVNGQARGRFACGADVPVHRPGERGLRRPR